MRGVEHLGERPAVECGASRQHLEQNCPGSEQIAARIDVLADDLLGRHVARRAHHHARAGQPVVGTERGVRFGPRQAEVEQLHAVRGQEHVGGLQVAMHDAARVQRRERGEHAEADRHRLGHAERATLQPLGQRFAIEQLHGDEQPAVVLADLVDLADVRVVHAGRRAGLAPETLRAVSSLASAAIVLRATVR